MKLRKLTLFSVAFVGLFMGSGCVKLWQKNAEIKTYMIEVTRGDTPLKQPLAQRLWIEDVNVLPPYNMRNLVLRLSDVEFTPTYYSELLMSPADNFRNAFFSWFSASGVFQHTSIAERTQASHRMVLSVMDFYGDETAKKAVLRIKVSLFDEKTKGFSILFSKEYKQSIDVSVMDVEQLIRAYNQALEGILSACESDVTAALK